jgi:hypothetical protein
MIWESVNKPLMLLVAEAVEIEPVSGSDFPVNREKYSEFDRKQPTQTVLRRSQPAKSNAYAQIR